MTYTATKNSKAYLSNRIKTASPIELVVIAYEGTINFLNIAKTSMENEEIRTAGHSVVRAQQVIHALRQSLDMDIGEISENLLLLYRFMDKNLTKAVKDKEVSHINLVLHMLKELRDSWKIVAAKESGKASSRDYSVQDSRYLNVVK